MDCGPWAQSSKYCLFNRWKTPAPCNDALTVITRRYLLLALVTHVLVSLQFYAGWPFDGYCATDQVGNPVCVGESFASWGSSSGRLSVAQSRVGDPLRMGVLELALFACWLAGTSLS